MLRPCTLHGSQPPIHLHPHPSVSIPAYQRLRYPHSSAFIRGCSVPLRLQFSLLLVILVPAVWAQEDTSAVQVLQELQDQFAVDPSLPTASEEVVAVEVRLPKDGVRAGARFEAFVMVHVAEGWHVNAHKPTLKYLIGTSLDVEPHDDFRVEAAYYPDPLFRTFAFTDDTLAVYEGEVAVILAVQAAKALEPGTHTMHSRLRVQACNDQVCLRPSTVEVPILVEVVTNN